MCRTCWPPPHRFLSICGPRRSGGSQVFFDTFRNEAPLTAHPLPAAQGGEFYGIPGEFAESGNAQWTVREYGADLPKQPRVLYEQSLHGHAV